MRRNLRRRIRRGIIFFASFLAFGLVVFFGITLIPFFTKIKFTSQSPKIIVPYVGGVDTESLKSKLEDKQIHVESLEISSRSGILTLKIQNGPIVLFSDTDNIDQQISSLQLIIRRLTIDKGTSGNIKKPSRIDLRFSNPVVEF